jgi:hypothetical protein
VSEGGVEDPFAGDVHATHVDQADELAGAG